MEHKNNFTHFEKYQGGKTMNEKLIYGSEATLEDLYRLNMLGFSFVIEDGVITKVFHSGRIDK